MQLPHIKLHQPPPTLAQMEANLIRRHLTFHNGCMKRAALSLNIGRTTLYRKMKAYKIKLERITT